MQVQPASDVLDLRVRHLFQVNAGVEVLDDPRAFEDDAGHAAVEIAGCPDIDAVDTRRPAAKDVSPQLEGDTTRENLDAVARAIVEVAGKGVITRSRDDGPAGRDGLG